VQYQIEAKADPTNVSITVEAALAAIRSYGSIPQRFMRTQTISPGLSHSLSIV